MDTRAWTRSMVLLACLAAGCGGGSSGAAGPDEAGPVLAGDAWRLPGTPVVKVIDLGAGELGVLAERLAYATGTPAGGGLEHGYVLDHPRLVLVLRHGREEPEELEGAAGEGELITDVAAGPMPGSLWVLTIRWNDQAEVLENRLALYAGDGHKRQAASFALEPAHFPTDARSAEAQSPYDPRPEHDTRDVARLATAGEKVGLVALNAAGTVHADRYTYREGELTRVSRTALTVPRRLNPQVMSGGTYDVFGWLGNTHRVHAAMSSEGVLHTAAVLLENEVSDVDGLFGSHLAEDLAEHPRNSQFAVLFAVSPLGEAHPVEARVLGPRQDSLLLALSSSRGRCLYGGLTREGANGRSRLVLFEAGSPRRVLEATQHASVALQAVAVDQTGRVWGAGSWGWTQNPDGLSIAGGERYLSPLPAEGQPWTEENVLAPGVRRSEIRALLEPTPGLLCVAGMDDGPATHTADADIALLRGDGFVECRAWPADAG